MRYSRIADHHVVAGQAVDDGDTIPEVAHYLLNSLPEDVADGSALRAFVAECMRVGMWGMGAGEPHGHQLAPGDLTLIYLGAPERLLVGRAKVASAVREWTPGEAQRYPGVLPCGVLLAEVEEWDPPLSMATVLRRIDLSEGARSDFEEDVVRITPGEYGAALAVASEA